MSEIPDVPITDEELYLANIAGESSSAPDAPTSREEQYMAHAAGLSDTLPAFPTSKKERYWVKICDRIDSGGDITLETLSVSDNGTYTPTQGHAYDEVVVAIPDTTGVSF